MEYERKKQIGVNKFLLSHGSDRAPRAFASRDKLIKYILDKKLLTVKEISEITGLALRSVYNVTERNQNSSEIG